MKVNYGSWLTFVVIIAVAGAVLGAAMNALDLRIPIFCLTAILVLFFAFVIIVAVRRARTGKSVLRQVGDERVNVIYANSARNALFVTYLAFFVHLVITNANTLDTIWLTIILAVGLLVLIGSALFYTFRKSPDIAG